MSQHGLQIVVYLVPGGEQDSQVAYQQLAALCESSLDFYISIYRGFNRYDGQWHLVLIGQPQSFAHYQQQVQAILSVARAHPVQVPMEGLAPLVQRFLQTQAEMMRTKTAFVERHHPLPSKRKHRRKR
jgi:hypothetical protein